MRMRLFLPIAVLTTLTALLAGCEKGTTGLGAGHGLDAGRASDAGDAGDAGDTGTAPPTPEPWSAALPGELQTVIATGERFVITGSRRNGEFEPETPFILLSRDGRDWEQIDLPADGVAWDVAHGNDTYVAIVFPTFNVDRDASILTSKDAKSWTARPAERGFKPYAVAFGDGRFVISGDNGQETILFSSTDGETWDRATTSLAWWSPKVEHARGRFILYGEGEVLGVSEDGLQYDYFQLPVNHVTWAGELEGKITAFGTYDCCFGEAPDAIRFMLMTSTDGETWTVEDFEPRIYVADAIHNGDRIVAATYGGLFAAEARQSGSVLQDLQAVTDEDGYFSSVAYGTGLTVAVGSNFDGSAWRMNVRLNQSSSAWTDPATIIRVR